MFLLTSISIVVSIPDNGPTPPPFTIDGCFTIAFEDLVDNSKGGPGYNDWDYNDWAVEVNIDPIGEVEKSMGYMGMEQLYINMTPVTKRAAYSHEFWITMPILEAYWSIEYYDGDGDPIDANGAYTNSGILFDAVGAPAKINDILIYESTQQASDENIKAILTLTPAVHELFVVYKFVFPFMFMHDEPACPYTFWGRGSGGSSLVDSFFQPYIYIENNDNTVPPTINDPHEYGIIATKDIRVFFIGHCGWTPSPEGHPLCMMDENDCIDCSEDDKHYPVLPPILT